MEIELTRNFDLPLGKAIHAQLVGEADAAHPREACGLLLGQSGRIVEVVPAINVHPTPETHFEIDPKLLIDAHRAARDGGPEVIGYYHSHPNGLAEPSATDRAMAVGDGRIWAIITADGIKFWKDGAQGFGALSYEVVEQ